MTYEECLGTEVTKKQALCEIKSHGQTQDEFFAEFGDHEEYDAQEILNWLGY